MAIYKITGVILRRRNYGEADRILSIFSPDRGKVEAIAKGARKMKSKLGGHLELFSEIALMLAKGRNLDVVTGARLQKHFSKIAEDLDRLQVAYLICEIVDKLTTDEHQA